MGNPAPHSRTRRIGPGWRSFLCVTAVFLLAMTAMAADFTLRERSAWQGNVVAGSPALRDWGWQGAIPYRRRLTFSDRVEATVPQAAVREGVEVYGSYDPQTGRICIRDLSLDSTATLWDVRRFPDRLSGRYAYADDTCLHEYGHALLSDWCRLRRGTLGGTLEFSWLTAVGGESWQRPLLPAELRPAWDDWRAGGTPEAYYGSVVTGSLGEYLAESFAHYLVGDQEVPAGTRGFFDGLGGIRKP